MSRIVTGRHFMMAALATATITAAACGNDDAGVARADTTGPMLLGRENMALVEAQQLVSGPTISGSLMAEQEATVRAEVAGAVLRVMAEPGQSVAAGAELARIDDTPIRDLVLSARSGVTMAQNSAGLADREVQRAVALLQAGAVAERVVEQARNAQSGAQAQLADARARLTQAEQQLAKTVVRAPFAGVVAARPANAGDVVAPGAPMFTVVNPASMRLEASVPAAELAQVRVGTPVEFTVNGYPDRRFTGRITRVNPVADPATRQVRLIVSLPNQGGTLVGGLFAEGRVTSQTRTGAVVPSSAVDEQGVRPAVVRVRNGVVERVEITLGIRDAARGLVEVVTGVAVGDTVLLATARGISPGTPVRVTVPADARP
jgi:membrane fusion protein, multidrug efflux system